jgi:hypothetical protein
MLLIPETITRLGISWQYYRIKIGASITVETIAVAPSLAMSWEARATALIDAPILSGPRADL